MHGLRPKLQGSAFEPRGRGRELPELIRTVSKQIAQVTERPMLIKREIGQIKPGALRGNSQFKTTDLIRDASSKRQK